MYKKAVTENPVQESARMAIMARDGAAFVGRICQKIWISIMEMEIMKAVSSFQQLINNIVHVLKITDII